MSKRITIIQGHPDGAEPHYCHAVAQAYREGALAAGHQVTLIDIGTFDIPNLRSRAAWQAPSPHAFVAEAQEAILGSDHVVLVFPLWMGTMPAHLKAYIEHVFTEEFAFDTTANSWTPKLRGRSARIIVTMGMPALAYRFYFFSHSLKNLRRNILGFSGLGPIRDSVIGVVEAENPRGREKWLKRMRALGAKGI